MNRISRFAMAMTMAILLPYTQVAQAGPLSQEAPDSPDAPLGNGFTFQGRLDKAGSPVTASCAMSFDLWDSLSGGAQVGATQGLNPVAVSDGLFTVVLNEASQFGVTAFTGQARFLEVAVQCPGDAAPTALPRQQLTAAPYALTALSANALQGRAVSATAPASGQVLTWNGSAWVPSAGTPGAQGPTGPTGPSGPSGATGPQGLPGTTDWVGLTNVPAGFADGVDNEGWTLSGNADATAGSRLGTTNPVTLTMIVSNATIMRFMAQQPVPFAAFTPNIIGGMNTNTIGPGVQGAVIGGGGNPTQSNDLFDNYSVIGGGIDNSIGANDGDPNAPNSNVIGGGFSNDLTGDFAVIAGGRQNNEDASHGVVGGGQNNTVATGSDYGVIPGGFAAVTTHFGQMAHAGGQFNNAGDAQASEYLLRNVTNNMTARELYLDCNEQSNSNLDTGTPCTVGESLTIPSGRAMNFLVMIVARTVTGAGALTVNSTASYFGSGLLRNNAGTTTLTIGAISEIGDAPATTALSVSITADDATDRLVVTGTSSAGGTVRWVAWIQAVEVAN